MSFSSTRRGPVQLTINNVNQLSERDGRAYANERDLHAYETKESYTLTKKFLKDEIDKGNSAVTLVEGQPHVELTKLDDDTSSTLNVLLLMESADGYMNRGAIQELKGSQKTKLMCMHVCHCTGPLTRLTEAYRRAEGADAGTRSS